ncbi:MAG: amino acid transporter, partial [Burkholderiaceae bacterium]
IEHLRIEANVSLSYFVNFCHSHGLAAKSYLAFGTDAVEEIAELSDRVRTEFPGAIFLTSKLITESENFMTRVLHNQAALALQRRLHLEGMQMVILPMKI